MGRRHELSENRVPEDGLVREADASDVEVHQLGVVVVACAEGDREADLSQGLSAPPPTPEKGLPRPSRSSGTWRRLKASTESKFRPAPPSMRVLVTATLQMVGVQSIGSIPEPAVELGWSSESKVRSASGAAQPGGAPGHLQAAPIWRKKGLMWRSEGGAWEPPSSAAIAWCARAA